MKSHGLSHKIPLFIPLFNYYVIPTVPTLTPGIKLKKPLPRLRSADGAARVSHLAQQRQKEKQQQRDAAKAAAVFQQSQFSYATTGEINWLGVWNKLWALHLPAGAAVPC